MADNGASGPEKSDSPGFGMKLTIAGIKQKFPSVINLSTEALSTMLKKNTCTGGDAEGNLIVLDARAEDEFNIGHIQGSRRVDYKDSTENLMSNIPELHSPNSKVTVVCYCSVGYRSSVVAQKIEEYLKQKDMPNRDAVKVYNLEGSIFKWANENRPMVDKNNTETKFAHPYNAVFGKLLKKELRKTAEDAQS